MAFENAHLRHDRALGELDHPPPTSPTFRSLNRENISHQVLDYHWEGEDLMGYVEVLPTKSGNMLRSLYLAGHQLGMSSRGWATLKEREGFTYLDSDFELITFDFVSDPSTEGAFLRPLQRRYEKLKPQIDIDDKFESFIRFCADVNEHGAAPARVKGDEAHLPRGRNAPAMSATSSSSAAAMRAGSVPKELPPVPGAVAIACEETGGEVLMTGREFMDETAWDEESYYESEEEEWMPSPTPQELRAKEAAAAARGGWWGRKKKNKVVPLKPTLSLRDSFDRLPKHR